MVRDPIAASLPFVEHGTLGIAAAAALARQGASTSPTSRPVNTPATDAYVHGTTYSHMSPIH